KNAPNDIVFSLVGSIPLMREDIPMAEAKALGFGRSQFTYHTTDNDSYARRICYNYKGIRHHVGNVALPNKYHDIHTSNISPKHESNLASK
ncbi:unnamed protein product, partial [Dovyalis caffra]